MTLPSPTPRPDPGDARAPNGPAVELRIGDRERSDAIDQLSAAFAEGRLTPDEFEQRSSYALAARTAGDLNPLLADLPGPKALAEMVDPPTPLSNTAPRLRGERHMVAVMSGAERKGRWRPAENMSAVAVMGGIELDFRDAIVVDAELSLTIVTVMGGAEITVPDDWTVSMSGMSIMGGRTIKRADSSGHELAPTAPVHLHVSGWVLMGGIDIKQRPR